MCAVFGSVGSPEVDGEVEGGGDEAKSPVLWIMEPSLRERMKVDCTPGREVRWERRALTWWGIWVWILLVFGLSGMVIRLLELNGRTAGVVAMLGGGR